MSNPREGLTKNEEKLIRLIRDRNLKTPQETASVLNVKIEDLALWIRDPRYPKREGRLKEMFDREGEDNQARKRVDAVLQELYE